MASTITPLENFIHIAVHKYLEQFRMVPKDFKFEQSDMKSEHFSVSYKSQEMKGE